MVEGVKRLCVGTKKESLCWSQADTRKDESF